MDVKGFPVFALGKFVFRIVGEGKKFHYFFQVIDKMFFS